MDRDRANDGEIYGINDATSYDTFKEAMEAYDTLPKKIRDHLKNHPYNIIINKNAVEELKTMSNFHINFFVEDLEHVQNELIVENLIGSYGYNHPEIAKYIDRI